MKNISTSKSGMGIARAMIIIILILIVYVAFNILKAQTAPEEIDKSEYETLLQLDLENNYPKGPYEVLHNYYSIVSYIYGGECNQDEIPILIEKQRMLLSDVLLGTTTFIDQVENCIAIVDKLNENDQKLLSVTQELPVADPKNENITFEDVTEYYNNGTRTKIKYTLILEDNKWKILRWDIVDESAETEAE